MGLDISTFEERLLGRGFAELIGVRLVDLEEGFCRLRLPFKAQLSRGDNLVHGGVIAALIDKAGTAAAWSYADIGEDARGATIALSVNYLRGADSCDLIAEGRVVRRGGTITVADVEVKNYSGDLIAKGPVTYKLSRPTICKPST